MHRDAEERSVENARCGFQPNGFEQRHTSPAAGAHPQLEDRHLISIAQARNWAIAQS
jgi:hypothetical protein